VTLPHGSRRSLGLLAAIIAVFLVLRLPLVYRQYGGRDEDFFSVPGWTVAREGIPRIPYVPSRNPESFFYRADEVLFALPPACFYWQAPFYWILPAGYGTSRMGSVLAGVIGIVLVYQLGRKLFEDEAVGLWAAGLYSISRVFFFPAINARPDMLCAMFGLAALVAAWNWQTTGRSRCLAIAGALLGLGMLTHPFALVYWVQVGLWAVVGTRGWRRLSAPALVAGSALAALGLWLPLIRVNPEVFVIQFSNNVLRPSGPGLLSRVILPWDSLVYQAGVLLEQTQVPQLVLMTLGLLAATALAARRRQRGALLAVVLAWSGCLLLAVTAGTHPSNGYWCYPGALVFLCVAYAAVEAGRWFAARLPRPQWSLAAGGLLLVAAMVPGSGIRAWLAHLRHWSDVNYRAPQFVRAMLADLPRDKRLVVDQAFVFEAYLSGPPVVLARTEVFCFNVSRMPYDFLIVGPNGRQHKIAAGLGARFVRAYGDPHDEFACYAQLYVPVAGVGSRETLSNNRLPIGL
jgi:hypothetical protein